MFEIILAFLLILSSFLTVFFLIQRLPGELRWLEKIALSVPLSLLAFSWIFYFFSSIDGVNVNAVYFSLALTCISVVIWAIDFKRIGELIRGLRKELAQNKLFVFSFLCLSLCFGYLLSTHVLFVQGDQVFSGGSTWGDLFLHLSIINSFIHGPNTSHPLWPIKYSLRIQSNLYYPFIPDICSVALITAGLSVRDSIIVPGLLVFMSFVVLIYSLFLRFTTSRKVSVLALLILFLAGGIGFVYLFHDPVLSTLDPVKILNQLPSDYILATAAGSGYLWNSFIGWILLPQLSSRFAFSMTAGIFLLFYLGLTADLKNRRSFFTTAGVIGGLLPFVQGEAVLSVAIVSVSLFVFFYPGNRHAKEYLLDWAHFVVPAVVLGLPQILYFASQPSVWGFVHFSPLWSDGSWQGIAWFYVMNLGPTIPLALVAILFLNGNQRRFFAGFLILLIVSSLFLFQPWTQDNSKALFQAFLMISCVASIAVQKIWAYKGGVLGKAIAVLIVFSLIASGTLALVYETQSHWQFLSPEGQRIGNWVVQNTSIDSVFLTTDAPNAIYALGGRQVVMGYRGWLWAQGYGYANLQNDVHTMYLGGSYSKALLSKYGVDYVAIGPSEYADYHANSTFFYENFPVAYYDGAYAVYKTGFGKSSKAV